MWDITNWYETYDILQTGIEQTKLIKRNEMTPPRGSKSQRWFFCKWATLQFPKPLETKKQLQKAYNMTHHKMD